MWLSLLPPSPSPLPASSPHLFSSFLHSQKKRLRLPRSSNSEGMSLCGWTQLTRSFEPPQQSLLSCQRPGRAAYLSQCAPLHSHSSLAPFQGGSLHLVTENSKSLPLLPTVKEERLSGLAFRLPCFENSTVPSSPFESHL